MQTQHTVPPVGESQHVVTEHQYLALQAEHRRNHHKSPSTKKRRTTRR